MNRSVRYLTLAFLVAFWVHHFRDNHANEATLARSVQADARRVIEAGSKSMGHPIFPYSIVPGGVHSSQDFEAAIASDPVVRNHYADFDGTHVQFIRTSEDRYEYVSYRRGAKVFWTTKRLFIPKGERLLTDGHNCIRSRCGNRLSSVRPPGYTEFTPPSDFVLNMPIGFRPFPLEEANAVEQGTPARPPTDVDHLNELNPVLPLGMPSPVLSTASGLDNLPSGLVPVSPAAEQWGDGPLNPNSAVYPYAPTVPPNAIRHPEVSSCIDCNLGPSAVPEPKSAALIVIPCMAVAFLWCLRRRSESRSLCCQRLPRRNLA